MFESEFVKTEYIPEYNMVFHIWKKECHADDYRNSVMASLKLLDEYDAEAFVVDAANGFEDTKDDAEWGFKVFLPEMKKTKCRKWIFILNEISEIDGEIDLWTSEICRYFEVIRVTSFDEAVKKL